MSLLKDRIELEVELAEFKAQQNLQQFPKALRWLLIGFVAAIIPGYFIAKTVSYNYWQKKYSQYAITAKASFTNPKPPTVSDIYLTTTGDGNYSAGVQVTNNNLDLSLPQANYEFDFYDAAKTQVYSETGSLFLLPNDQKYIVAPHFTSKDAVVAGDFHFTAGLHWEKRLSIPQVNIQTSSVDAYNQLVPQGYVAEGSYLNNSPYELGQVRLTFLILDSTGKIVGISRRDDFTVAPYERRTYKQLWPNLGGDPSFTVKVFAETNPFDSSNLTIPQTPSNSASDLSHPAQGNN